MFYILDDLDQQKVYDFDAQKDDQLQKIQPSTRSNMRTRSNKEPELIELSSSDEDGNDDGSRMRREIKRNEHNNNNNGNDNQNSNDLDYKNEQNQYIDEKYSFRPWSVLYSDIDTSDFKSKLATIPGDFEFETSIGFVRFGCLVFNSGTILFRSSKGISLMTKG